MMNEGSDEAFDEYDEDNEAADETFEASDEADEAADEADEASDESYEASDEADEASDEGSDEGVDEAIDPRSSRIRAYQDQARRNVFQSGLNRVAATEARRAAETRQALTDRLRNIRLGGATRSQTASPLQGGLVRGTLANGRSVMIKFTPALAPVSQVNQLRATFNKNDKQQAAALATQRKALASLASAQAAAVSKLTAQQVKSDKELGNRIAAGHNRLDKRISTEVAANKASLDKQNRRMMRHLRRIRQRQLLNSVLITSAMPLYAAYGQRDLFSRNNLILTGALGGFLVGDEVIDAVSGKSKSGVPSTIANAWSWAAPVANFATSYFLLKDRQNERFVTGIAPATATTLSTTVPLVVEPTIGKDSKDDFVALPSPPVVVTVAEGGDKDTVLSASVSQGKITIKLIEGAAPTKIAYMVDTQGTL